MKVVIYALLFPLVAYVLAWALCIVCLAGAYLSAAARNRNPN